VGKVQWWPAPSSLSGSLKLTPVVILGPIGQNVSVAVVGVNPIPTQPLCSVDGLIGAVDQALDRFVSGQSRRDADADGHGGGAA